MRNIIGIKSFGKFYPGRTTTRKLRHGEIARRNTPHQFACFFHDSHIGTEIGIEYKEENFDPNEPIRLNKYLANAGVCSRREADEFILSGAVTTSQMASAPA